MMYCMRYGIRSTREWLESPLLLTCLSSTSNLSEGFLPSILNPSMNIWTDLRPLKGQGTNQIAQ